MEQRSWAVSLFLWFPGKLKIEEVHLGSSRRGNQSFGIFLEERASWLNNMNPISYQLHLLCNFTLTLSLIKRKYLAIFLLLFHDVFRTLFFSLQWIKKLVSISSISYFFKIHLKKKSYRGHWCWHKPSVHDQWVHESVVYDVPTAGPREAHFDDTHAKVIRPY